MSMSNYLEVELRKHIFRTGSFTKPAALYISLHTADPSETGASEVTGGSYARVQRDPLDANWTAVSALDGNTDNAAVINFPTPSANWGTVTHFAIWDAATTGNCLIEGTITPNKTINNGDPAPSFAIGALDVTFA